MEIELLPPSAAAAVALMGGDAADPARRGLGLGRELDRADLAEDYPHLAPWDFLVYRKDLR